MLRLQTAMELLVSSRITVTTSQLLLYRITTSGCILRQKTAAHGGAGNHRDYANLNSALSVKVYSGEGQINGFESWAVVDNHTVTFCIRGTVATNLGTSDQYAYVASFPQLKSLITLNRLRIKRIEIMPTIKGQIRFEQDTGILRIGYTYNNSGLSVDIPEGTALYLEETFVL